MTPQTNLITIPTIEDATRRQFISGALASAFLIACGDEEEASAPEALTKMFTDATGNTVEVPTRPQRIVVLHYLYGTAELLSLGMPVVGVGWGDWDWPESLTDYFDMEGISRVGYTTDIDIEKIITLEPDLIIGWIGRNGQPGVPEVLEQCRKIAPTVLVDVIGRDGDLQPSDVMPAFTELVNGDKTVLDAYEREYQGLLDEIRAMLAPRPADFTARQIAFYDGGQYLMNAGNMFPVLHVLVSAGCTPGDTNNSSLTSMENVRDANADLLIAWVTGADHSDSPLFQALPVVQAGQTVKLTKSFTGANYPNYIAAARWVIEALKTMPQPLRHDLA